MKSRKADFLLARGETYLNAGTFSALPRAVLSSQARLMAEAEANPTRIAAWRGRGPLWRVHRKLAASLGADPRGLVLHVNVTQALNQALFGLKWPKGGEFLASSEEYGAVVNAAREVARRRGMTFRIFDLPAMPRSEGELVACVEAALSPRTVGVLLSHVTSSRGLCLPIARVARALLRRGVRLVVDGAHAPGLVPLDLRKLGASIYGGNLHKWFMGPKGTGFLHVAAPLRGEMEPQAVGWGGVPRDSRPAGDAHPGNPGRFYHVFRSQGLRDFSPFLALEAAIAYRRALGERAIRGRVAELCEAARQELGGRLGLRCLSPRPPLQAGLVAFEPPPAWRRASADSLLFQRHRITVATWKDARLGWILRVSPHIWNDERDLRKLADALSE